MLLIHYFVQLFELVVEADDVSDEQKARICKSLAIADKVMLYKVYFIIFFKFVSIISLCSTA